MLNVLLTVMTLSRRSGVFMTPLYGSTSFAAICHDSKCITSDCHVSESLKELFLVRLYSVTAKLAKLRQLRCRRNGCILDREGQRTETAEWFIPSTNAMSCSRYAHRRTRFVESLNSQITHRVYRPTTSIGL